MMKMSSSKSNSNCDLLSDSFEKMAQFRDLQKMKMMNEMSESLGLCGAPDDPQGASTNNREGCDCCGELLLLSEEGLEVTAEDITKAAKESCVRITFKLHITRDTDVTWDALLTSGKIYIRIDSNAEAISKMGFLGIMEYAEDVLKVSHIVVCFDKNHPNRPLLVRTFMYIGFSPLPPDHELIPPTAVPATSVMYMAYSIV